MQLQYFLFNEQKLVVIIRQFDQIEYKDSVIIQFNWIQYEYVFGGLCFTKNALNLEHMNLYIYILLTNPIKKMLDYKKS